MVIHARNDLVRRLIAIIRDLRSCECKCVCGIKEIA
jgi:hypothetical protein